MRLGGGELGGGNLGPILNPPASYSPFLLSLNQLQHVTVLCGLRFIRNLTETLKLLEKQVQCSICLETYQEPKALSCLHAYCHRCIQQLLQRQKRDQEVVCPQCRSVVAVPGNNPSSLPTVFFINGLIEVYKILGTAESNDIACQSCSSDAKAISFCHTCSMFICASCDNAHKTMSAFAGHETVLVSEMREGSLNRLHKRQPPTTTCRQHKGEMKLYCIDCNQLICQGCTRLEHAGHTCNSVRGVADASREEILSRLVPLHDIHNGITTAIAKLEDSKKEIRDQGKDIATTITLLFKELQTVLSDRQEVLLQQTQEVVERKVDTLDRQQEDLQLAQATINSLTEFVQRTAENASDEEFISMEQQMTSRVQQVTRKYHDMKLSPKEVADTFVAVPPPTSLAELCKKSSVAEVNGPGLKFATTKEVARFTVHTLDSHPSIQHQVSAELKSSVDASIVQATVTRQSPFTYELSYIPTTRGRHQLTVQVDNIQSGIFQVFVKYPPTQLGTSVRVIEGVKPYYIAVGDKGKLFVTEDERYTVLDSQGQRVLTIGSRGKPPFWDEDPTGIATDSEGNVYVTSGHSVQKFNKYGEVKSVGRKGRLNGQFEHPWGVRYHNNQVYVCDRDNGRVQVLDTNLNFVRSFTGSGPGQLKDPVDIDIDRHGYIYVLDENKNKVLVFSEDGQYLRHFGQRGQGKDELGCPRGLCVSGDFVYITEWHNSCVSVFHTCGEFVHSFGRFGPGRGELKIPYGIAIDQDGFVFVCDCYNNRTQVF